MQRLLGDPHPRRKMKQNSILIAGPGRSARVFKFHHLRRFLRTIGDGLLSIATHP
jgi:hypothetical protein